MRNLKKFENFDGFAADEEADQMKIDQAFGERDAQDEFDAQEAEAFAGEESQEEEGLELEEIVDRVLAAIEECGEDCEEEELRNKVKAVLADFHQAEETEEEDDNYDPENDEDFGAMRADGSDDLGHDEEGHEEGHEGHGEEGGMYKFEGLKKFNNFK
jgi:hypothetical protein